LQYTRNTANVIAVEDSLGKARRQVFEALQGTPLHVVLCDVVGLSKINTLVVIDYQC
jgi:hypothetical protein